jgi:N-acetyl-gamma-glutamyl-phosphate reductase
VVLRDKARIGIVGGRGHVGQELLAILARHARFEVAFVSSRSLAGESVGPLAPGLRFEDLDPHAALAREVDVLVLALPNGLSSTWVTTFQDRSETVLLDLSSDHRLEGGWVYGLPELHRAAIARARRIANPGCYATAAALLVAPVADLLQGPAIAFGVSGYSGAGTTPSPRNDAAKLRDDLMPYQLVGHLHEREVTRHAGPVSLMPHVAGFFRGLSVTASFTFERPLDLATLTDAYLSAYRGEPMVRVAEAIPTLAEVRDRPHALIGGFAVDVERRRGVAVAVIDNLLKGAASQAMQNLNLAFGFGELMGVEPWPEPAPSPA